MANIDDAIYSLLTDNASLAAHVQERIYPNIIPDKRRMPAVAIYMISQPKIRTMGACSGNPQHPRFQISCWGKTKNDVLAVAGDVIAALEDYSGTVASVAVKRIYYDDATDDYDHETKRFVRHLDFIVWY